MERMGAKRVCWPAIWIVAVGLCLAVAALVLRPRTGRPQCEGVAAAEEQEVPGEEAGEEPAAPEQAPGEKKDKPLEWDRPRFEEGKAERLRMVKRHIEGSMVRDERVLEAMRNVPRHLFMRPQDRRVAYEDRPWPIGYGQTISQPSLVAYMTELLELKPGQKVLEIGTGSGYQAAILSELTPYVFTIEILKELAEQAKERFKKLGYKTIRVRQGDGYYGWPEEAPFDAIIVTAAAGHVPPPLIEQLKPGGRMVIPVGGPWQTQYLVRLRKDKEGALSTESLLPVRFVPMTGRVQESAP